MADGHLNKCIECAKKDIHNSRRKKKKYYDCFDKDRYRNNILRLWKHKYRSMFRRIKGMNKHSNLIGKDLMPWPFFLDWCNSTKKDFIKIHRKWKKSNFERKLAPSIDRIDNTKGYTFGNLQWITQSQNSKKYVNKNYGKSPIFRSS
jgi:hypothetical protein